MLLLRLPVQKTILFILIMRIIIPTITQFVQFQIGKNIYFKKTLNKKSKNIYMYINDT